MAGHDEPAVLVPEGKCAVYTMEDGAELAHCVESVVRWGADVVQVHPPLRLISMCIHLKTPCRSIHRPLNLNSQISNRDRPPDPRPVS